MATHSALLSRSAEVFGFDGQIVKLRFSAGQVYVSAVLDEYEHARRARTGLGAITDRELITALWELPHAAQIPDSAVRVEEKALLERAPVSVVASDGELLIRQSRPPLTVSGVLAVGRKLERLLQRVGELSAVASMAVVVQHEVDPVDPWMLNAALYGVGVASFTQGVLTTISAPEPVVPTLSPFFWWVAELAYEQLTCCLR